MKAIKIIKAIMTSKLLQLEDYNSHEHYDFTITITTKISHSCIKKYWLYKILEIGGHMFQSLKITHLSLKV